jgi:hypothetical protein
MMSLLAEADSFARAVVVRLLDGSLQGALAVAFVWVVCACCRSAPPSIRAWLWWLASLKLVMALLAVLLGLLGWISPATLPLCFQPEQGGQLVLICPTGQSGSVAVDPAAGSSQPQIDASQNSPVNRVDVALVEAIGLIAASIASAAALRRLRGSSEPHGLPVALALLKLPTGALTAVLGLLLMRGEFLPGLSALDSSGQIIAWAIVFGYAQQLFTRFVDEQADSVLNDVRGSRTTGETPCT